MMSVGCLVDGKLASLIRLVQELRSNCATPWKRMLPVRAQTHLIPGTEQIEIHDPGPCYGC
jgi:hypothetical protein